MIASTGNSEPFCIILKTIGILVVQGNINHLIVSLVASHRRITCKKCLPGKHLSRAKNLVIFPVLVLDSELLNLDCSLALKRVDDDSDSLVSDI